MPIDSQTYERVPAFDWRLVALNHESAQANREFWEMADAADAVELHVSKPYRQDASITERHFGVFLDTVKLARHPQFSRHCVDIVRSMPQPDVVISPEHEHVAAVDHILDEAGISARRYRIDIGPLDQEIADALRSARCIWVADDAVVTGATFRALRNVVFEAIRELPELPTVHAFASVARTGSRAELRAACRPYRDGEGDHCHFGATVLLPKPGRPTCPWCQERRLLGEVLNDLSERSRVPALQRIRRLDLALQVPFLLMEDDRAGPDQITSGSFFGSLHQRAAFAACVSAVQFLCDGFSKPDERNTIDVLRLAMVVSAYFEAVFVSAVLRTCSPVQLWCPRSEPELTQVLQQVDLSRLLPGHVSELGMAAALGKIPAQAVYELVERARQARDTPILQMLAEVISLNIEGQRRV
jgi:hypothetical protein